MGLKTILQTFTPLIKNMHTTIPPKDLKIIGLFTKNADTVVGDIARFTTNMAKQTDYVVQSKAIMTSQNNPLNGIKQKWFSSYEEFKKSALERISQYKNLVPNKLYTSVEKSAQSNEFKLTKSMNEYYAKLNECKTIKEAAEIYPEFTHINIDFAQELKNRIKISIPENVCKDAIKFKTEKERLEYMMKYFDDAKPCIKKWQTYPEILEIQREIAKEVAEGKYSGALKVNNSWLYGNKESFSNYLLNNDIRDNVFLSYLKQYYVEGKSLQEITPVTVKNRAIMPVSLNEDFRFVKKMSVGSLARERPND